MILKKFSRRQKSMKNYQGGKELTQKSLNATASYLFNSGSIFKLTFSCFSPVYLETLTLIHQQVVMATEDQILDFFQYYLQIMKKAAMEKEIWQNVSEDVFYFDKSSKSFVLKVVTFKETIKSAADDQFLQHLSSSSFASSSIGLTVATSSSLILQI